MSNRIGVVGLGAMGLVMLTGLRDAGATVTGFDVSDAARGRATETGAQVAPSLEDLAADSDVVLLSLPTPAVVTGVVGELVEAGASGLRVLDTSTIDPGTAAQAAQTLQAAGHFYADCPVLGRPGAVGKWTIPVGGDQVSFECARQALAPLARTVHVGAVGSAATIKILNNMMLATINAVTAEALVLAQASGVDPGVFVDTVVDSGAASVSGLFKDVAPRAVDGDFAPTFSVNLMRKDNALALQLAESHALALPVASAAQLLNTMAVAAGHGDEDSVAVIKALEKVAGISARRHRADDDDRRAYDDDRPA